MIEQIGKLARLDVMEKPGGQRGFVLYVPLPSTEGDATHADEAEPVEAPARTPNAS